ncbi:MAG: 1-acyl-sn-glycerol-3-phosphate acyltransferase [Acidimicrobiia bacterium]
MPVVVAGSAALGATVGAWAPIAAALDLAQSETRVPRLRLLSFAWAWTTLETIGVGAAGVLWLAGKGNDRDAHYALQRWWAARLVDSLRVLADLRIEVDDLDALAPGPIVMAARHSSVADSLLPAWLLGRVGMRPRYLLKDDLLLDPCLDIVGSRLPNHFVNRSPDDNAAELELVEALARRMGGTDAAVVFPEGMVVTEPRRAAAIARIAERDPDRARRLRVLQLMAPVRAGGTAALLRGSPEADLVVVTHLGLDALRRVSDATRHVPLAEPLRVFVRRIPRREVPTGDAFPAWFDAQWDRADRELSVRVGRSAPPRPEAAAGIPPTHP